MVDGDSAVVASDRTKVWRWGNTLAPFFVIMVCIGVFGSNTPEGSNGQKLDVITLLICVPLALLGAYLPCIFWRLVTASRAYEVTGRSLRVWSRGKVIKEIPRDEIIRFRMRGRVNGWSYIFSPSTWLTWPRGFVTVKTVQGPKTIRLPELILWGDAVREAEMLVARSLVNLEM